MGRSSWSGSDKPAENSILQISQWLGVTSWTGVEQIFREETNIGGHLLRGACICHRTDDSSLTKLKCYAKIQDIPMCNTETCAALGSTRCLLACCKSLANWPGLKGGLKVFDFDSFIVAIIIDSLTLENSSSPSNEYYHQ